MTKLWWRLSGVLLMTVFISAGFLNIAWADTPDFKPYHVIIQKGSGDVYLEVLNLENNNWSGYVKIGIKYHGGQRTPVIKKLYFEPEADMFTVYLFNINDKGYGYDEGQAVVEVNVNSDNAVAETNPNNNIRSDLITFVKVTKVELFVTPADWRGACPKTFTLKAKVYVLGRGSVLCKFSVQGWSSNKRKLVNNKKGDNVLETKEEHVTLPTWLDPNNTKHSVDAKLTILHPSSEVALYSKSFVLDCSNK